MTMKVDKNQDCIQLSLVLGLNSDGFHHQNN